MHCLLQCDIKISVALAMACILCKYQVYTHCSPDATTDQNGERQLSMGSFCAKTLVHVHVCVCVCSEHRQHNTNEDDGQGVSLGT